MPDPSGGPDPGPAKCRNGHPVAAADRVWHKGQMRCAACLREARRRWRETRLAKPATYAYCGRCGAAKYEDARTYCGPCRHATRGEVAKAYDVFLDQAGVSGRATFVIDANGIIVDVDQVAPLETPDMDRLIASLATCKA